MDSPLVCDIISQQCTLHLYIVNNYINKDNTITGF